MGQRSQPVGEALSRAWESPRKRGSSRIVSSQSFTGSLYSSFNTSFMPSRLPSSIQIQMSGRHSPGGSMTFSIQTMRRSSA